MRPNHWYSQLNSGILQPKGRLHGLGVSERWCSDDAVSVRSMTKLETIGRLCLTTISCRLWTAGAI